MSDVTRILNAIESGDRQASAELLPAVYDELRKLAAQRLGQERPGQTLDATALVHEAYVRLVGTADPRWSGRAHFFAAAAEAMRRIVIDRARARKRLKRGGAFKRIELNTGTLTTDPVPDDLLDLDAALTKLAAEDPVKAELVKLRFFAGMTNREAAEFLGISTTTAERYWTYARAWLYAEIRDARAAE
jgi:RNA polymerase sigma factor (TIGR02999 family)